VLKLQTVLLYNYLLVVYLKESETESGISIPLKNINIHNADRCKIEEVTNSLESIYKVLENAKDNLKLIVDNTEAINLEKEKNAYCAAIDLICQDNIKTMVSHGVPVVIIVTNPNDNSNSKNYNFYINNITIIYRL